MSREFIYVLKLAKKSSEKFSTAEEAIMEEHFEGLKKASAEGKLLFAGPCEDRAFGIVVFRANSKEEAEKLMRNDPAVKQGVMTAELHPFHVSLREKAIMRDRMNEILASNAPTVGSAPVHKPPCSL